jgi:hypothetical protein
VYYVSRSAREENGGQFFLKTEANTSQSAPQNAGVPFEEIRNTAGSTLSEDQVLAILCRPELPGEIIALLGKNPNVIKNPKALFALITHNRAPRHASIPLLRQLFTFDLMRVALMPAMAPDIKRIAEDQILNRRERLSAGEKISLARRASARVAAALLRDADARVISSALHNPHMVEASVVAALMRKDAVAVLFELVSNHSEWSQRREVQIALLKSENTPMERAKEFARHFSQRLIVEIIPESRRHELGEAARARESSCGFEKAQRRATP